MSVSRILKHAGVSAWTMVPFGCCMGANGQDDSVDPIAKLAAEAK